MARIERRTGEADLEYRFSQYEAVLARHAQLLQEAGALTNETDLSMDVDPITQGPTIEQRRAATQRILPALVLNPSPLNIHRKEPISQQAFGNLLRWCINNIRTVIPEETIDFPRLTDCIYLVYDVIYGSWDVRSSMGRVKRIERRERIGGTNDRLSVWEETRNRIHTYSLDMVGTELEFYGGFRRKGIQAVISGMTTIKYTDFIPELQNVGGYARNQTDQWGNYLLLPMDTKLTHEDIRIMFEAISTIGEYRMARKPLEDKRLKSLIKGGFRLDSDLVTDFWYARS